VKKLLLSTVLALGWFAAPVVPAHAQVPQNCGVNFTPQVGINCANVRQNTYVAQILGLVPVTGATDVFCLNASASKNIQIRRIKLSGIATAATNIPASLIRRNTLDTGTAGTPFIAAMNGANPATTASAVSYTANPTITDTTSHQTVRASYMLFGTAAVPLVPVEWDFGTAIDAYDQGADLQKGATTTQYCINLGAAAIGGGQLLSGFIEYTEN